MYSTEVKRGYPECYFSNLKFVIIIWEIWDIKNYMLLKMFSVLKYHLTLFKIILSTYVYYSKLQI